MRYGFIYIIVLVGLVAAPQAASALTNTSLSTPVSKSLAPAPQYTREPNNLDSDGDGFTVAQGDCNNNDATIAPNKRETCGDGKDNNCKDGIDEDSICDPDGDGYTFAEGDCNTSNGAIYPGQTEICDGKDNNCTGGVDEGVCDTDGDGYTTAQGDCNNADGTIYPGQTEICDGKDNNCTGGADDGVCVVIELEELVINAATPEEVIDAFKKANEGEAKDALGNTTKWPKVILNLEAGKTYTFTDAMVVPMTYEIILNTFSHTIVVNGGDDVIFERDANATTPFRFIKTAGMTVTFNDIVFQNWGGEPFFFRGGVIHNNSGLMTINRCVFHNNKIITDPASTTEAAGGAIANQAPMLIRDSVFYDNHVGGQAEAAGGAIWSETNTLVVINTIFASNSAEGTGVDGDGNSLVRGGAAAQNRGTGANWYINCTFIGNHTDLDGGTISATDSTTTTNALFDNEGEFYLQNSIIAGNSGKNFNTDFNFIDSKGYNIIDDDTGDAWAIDGSDLTSFTGPIYENLDEFGNYDVVAASPIIDTIPAASCVDHNGDTITEDGLGTDRPQGLGCDPGAIEFVPVTTAQKSPAGPNSWSIKGFINSVYKEVSGFLGGRSHLPVPTSLAKKPMPTGGLGVGARKAKVVVPSKNKL